MSSSTSSSDWRRFFRLAAGTAALAVALVYVFVVLVDPFDTLPLSPPADRVPVASNQRFAYPALARSPRFDSAVFGTSTSRLLQPAVLNAEFGAHFANLAMNAATAYEQTHLMAVFGAAHPAARVVVVGLDIAYCMPGRAEIKFTPREFPAWMYAGSQWRGYGHMLNLYAVQEAGQEFGILFGIKKQVFGSDGYTSFVPPDSAYDPARVALHLKNSPLFVPPGEDEGKPADWLYIGLDRLDAQLVALGPRTRKILFFVPYIQQLMPEPGSAEDSVWHECKRRVTALAHSVPNTVAVDFMLPSPITRVADNYWDGAHYRTGIAELIARDLAAADRGEASEDYRVLDGNGRVSAQR